MGEIKMKINYEHIADSTQHFLRATNFENKDDFKGTPERVMRMWKEFFNVDSRDFDLYPIAATEKKGLVLLSGYVSWGFCPHHLLPVKYSFYIGYIPDKYYIGLSKLARLADYKLRTFPLQEDLTVSITEKLNTILEPEGYACAIKGYHLCSAMRGVKGREAEFYTSCFSDEVIKNEILSIMNLSR